ncbi:OsmC family protein [Formosa algae]|jgi:osmotically inducible protein OsmC|uniref:Osmotically inducible protein OsmC n=1 Tax=Formosa algae TaxID=225843 RepID=A0A9X0YN50_9FLAO|nr:OsmC family protein [Formosa algae]MBP1840988.1 osmotically inducible protein OsmC [Formosa algae]MDQ0336115.1 osmotically inducible protein OsmC [Formosa algae]OEI79902.1 OsmC family peroxiredoxin [Formosa algae]PNW26390.1 OsmC family peroxiredoxin [Formosa algae]
MKFTRQAQAQWKGSGKDGHGQITTASKVLDHTAYSFNTRFEDGEKGTNPEELIGAAHAGCFAMQLSFLLNEADYTATSLDVDASVNFEDGAITKIILNLVGDVPEIDAEQFQQIAHEAKNVCPVSKVLQADIELKVSLKRA